MTCSRRLLIAAAALAAVVPSGLATAAPATPAAQMERALVAEMNEVRADHGRSPLRRVSTLTRAARGHSRGMAARGVLTHDGPTGRPFWTRVVAAGYPRDRAMAENIAQVPRCGVAAARLTVRLWMNSPAHRANLLSRRYRTVGAGVACAPRRGLAMVTADYGG